ncbi:MAG: hypothetical protein HOY79_46115 [Streptomyces sp.]|nr:hypothetical protein [Streptomyces sp.]
MTDRTLKVKRFGPKRGGPYPYLRLDIAVKWRQGGDVVQLVAINGLSFRQAAASLGLSPTTAWRRYWWWMDSTLPAHWGYPDGPIPPQRGTRACPRGRPYLPTYDGPNAKPRRSRRPAAP